MQEYKLSFYWVSKRIFFFFFFFFTFWQNLPGLEHREQCRRVKPHCRAQLCPVVSLRASYKPHSVCLPDLLLSRCPIPADRCMPFLLPPVSFLIHVIISHSPDQSSKMSSNVAFTVNGFPVTPRYCHSFLCRSTVYIDIVI